MATLINNNKFGYQPPQVGALTISYLPAGYGPNVVGVHSPGVAPDTLVDATQQQANNSDQSVSTVSGLAVGTGAGSGPDNFLPCTQVIETGLNTPVTNAVAIAGVTPAVNAAQHPSAAKSLAPGHE
jgi:hypothetical protein